MRVLLVCVCVCVCALNICLCGRCNHRALWLYHRLLADTCTHFKRDDVILPRSSGNIGGIIMQCRRQNVCVRFFVKVCAYAQRVSRWSFGKFNSSIPGLSLFACVLAEIIKGHNYEDTTSRCNGVQWEALVCFSHRRNSFCYGHKDKLLLWP